MSIVCKLRTLAFAGALLAACGEFAAADFDLSWYTVDGGGAMFTSGGTFQLSGTIGQPDAGPATSGMAGGTFTLDGGFWQPSVLNPCADFLCGDANCDGSFDGADIDPFFLAISDPTAWIAAFPNCSLLCTVDVNHDGVVDGADIYPFFTALAAGSCP